VSLQATRPERQMMMMGFPRRLMPSMETAEPSSPKRVSVCRGGGLARQVRSGTPGPYETVGRVSWIDPFIIDIHSNICFSSAEVACRAARITCSHKASLSPTDK
jgi:hypothetical protein